MSKTTLPFVKKGSGSLLVILTVSVLLLSSNARADTVARFDTVMGVIYVDLYDDITPKTIENFLNYVADGDYDNAVFHRSIPGFMVQGGWFRPGSPTMDVIDQDPPVQNEFHVSNTRGTIAMAKLKFAPDSATSQWFFNLEDNSFLDNQNGGFTAFGEVMGSGMDVIDAIAALPTLGAIGAENIYPGLADLPLRGDPQGNYVEEHQYVIINTVTELHKGDATRDFLINGDDLQILKDNYGLSTDLLTTWEHADFNVDLFVNVGDLGILAAHFELPGGTVYSGSGSGLLPEPATFALLGVGALPLIRKRRR